jgi:hypothetical protein
MFGAVNLTSSPITREFFDTHKCVYVNNMLNAHWSVLLMFFYAE